MGQKINSLQSMLARIRRQNNTTNTTQDNARIEVGWGWMQNTGGSSIGQLTENVTFASAFTERPIVLLTYGGETGNVAPSYGLGGRVTFGSATMNASSITTTGFEVAIGANNNIIPAGACVYYQWMAIGVGGVVRWLRSLLSVFSPVSSGGLA